MGMDTVQDRADERAMGMTALRQFIGSQSPALPTPQTVAATADYITTISKDDQNKRRRIRCFPSGLYVNPVAMRARDIRLHDIAHHTANICRYTGACPQNYSVAHHSVLVSQKIERWGGSLDLQLAGLLHDAAEYVFNDIASPVKHDPRMKWYRDLEHETTRMIFCVFGVDPDLLPLTKAADGAVFADETRSFFGGGGNLVPLPPFRAKQAFLRRFYALAKDVQ